MPGEAEAATSTASRADRRRSRLDLTAPSLLGLPVAWLVVFFVVPIGIVAAYSLDALSITNGPHPVTLTAWRHLVTGDPFLGHVYLALFWKSVKMSLIVSAVIVALAYPLAYYLALSGTKRKYVLLLLLIAPFLTSYLLRVLAWKVLLGDQGPINSLLSSSGVTSPDHPLTLIYTQFAVMLVLGYIWLPFVALPIFVSLESLDRRLLEAATDLGASRWQAFIRVTLPLSAPGRVRRFPVRVHPHARGVRHAVARRWHGRLHVRQPDRRSLRHRLPRLAYRLRARALPAGRRRRAHPRLRALSPAATGRRGLMDVALSRRGAWLLRAFFALIVVFLYAPIVVLLIFSFNDSALPTFPLSGFTLRWYHQFLTNPDLQGALKTSAAVAALSSVGAVILGLLAAIALVRHPFRGTGPVSALLLSPLVIPFIVFGISLLLLFHAFGVELGVKTVVIGHIVITIPYAILVMLPRLQQIDVSLEQAAYDLGASRLRTFRSITFPLMLPAIVSAYLIAFTTSFDEYAVASFVKGSTVTFPVYLYAALRFPNQLPQVIAVAVVVITVSLLVVVAAEVGRRVAERRLGELEL